MQGAISSLVGLFALTWSFSSTPAQGQPSWFATWETSPAGLLNLPKLGNLPLPPPLAVKGTLRYRVRISQGGRQIRLRFSNEYGDVPLSIQGASVGRAGAGFDALPGSVKPATFAGKTSIVLPAGAPALSDPIDLSLQPLDDLVVSVYVPEEILVRVATTGPSKPYQQVAEGVDATMSEQLPAGKMLNSRPLISEVDALADHRIKVVAALGDSITDGGVDPATGERGWPGALARRLSGPGTSVVNAGIGGNRLLRSMSFCGTAALARLDRDVFSVPGLSDIVVLEGINDIGMSGKGGRFGDLPLVRPEELIAAYSQIVARAHEHGCKIFGATILPFQGAFYYSKEKEQVRQAVNAWIRTARVFDGVVDFDAALRDPSRPLALKADYDSGDHLHPSFAGYRHMGDVIDLHLFDP